MSEPGSEQSAQQAGSTIHLPPLRSLLRHAGPPLLESTLIPLGLFWLLLSCVGFTAGLWAALGWSAFAIAVRLAWRQRVLRCSC